MPKKLPSKPIESSTGESLFRTAPPETGTVRRVLLLLSCLADYPGETANSLARRLNLPRSTVHRLLAALSSDGFAQHHSDGSFAPGLELYRISGKLNADIPYAKLAAPLLQQLSSQFRETSVLTLLARQQLKMFFSATASPPDPMRYNIGMNRLESLAWGATGRSLLTYLSNEELETVIKAAEPSPFDNRPLDERELRMALVEIRNNGYAVTHAHRTANTIGIAVPFFNGSGEVAGNFAFLIPDSRYSPQTLNSTVSALQDAARVMSSQLGFSGARGPAAPDGK